jgi:hypothetical protein
MLRRFALSLIGISTLIYGSIFFSSVIHNTGFFDEILIQLNRMNANMSNMDEIQHSRQVLNAIMNNDHPPDNWTSLIAGPPEKDPVQLFYFYKVWMKQSGLTPKDIKRSYAIFKSVKNNLLILNMRYGKNKPVLQFPFMSTPQGQVVSGLFFAINELPFSADINNDGRVDQKDVLAAKTK